MPKKKLNLAFIEDEKARKMTFKKRAKGLVRKTQELSVLCGVDACAVIYGPYEQAPVLWPQSETEVRRVISNFKRKPEDERSQWQFNQETFMQDAVKKAEEKLLRLQRRNRELEIENLATDIMVGKVALEQVPLSEMRDLFRVLNEKSKSIEHRIMMLNALEDNSAANDGSNPGVVPNQSADIGIGAVVAQTLSQQTPQASSYHYYSI